jgi:hypothetical protein
MTRELLNIFVVVVVVQNQWIYEGCEHRISKFFSFPCSLSFKCFKYCWHTLLKLVSLFFFFFSSQCAQIKRGFMDHRAPNGGARESIQRTKEIGNPVGATLWTNQYPGALDSICICIKNALVGHHWKERPTGQANFICPSTGERQGQKMGMGG